jgi:hypothetical protein
LKILLKLILAFAAQPKLSLDPLHAFIKAANKEKPNKTAFLQSFYLLIGIFLQENWVGRSCLFLHCDEKWEIEGKKKIKEMDARAGKVEEKIELNMAFAEGAKMVGVEVEGCGLGEVNLMDYDLAKLHSKDFLTLTQPSLHKYFRTNGEVMYRLVAYKPILLILKEATALLKATSPFW